MNASPALASFTVVMSHLVARCRWLQAPVGLLLVFLQRTPAIRVAAMAEGASRVVASEGMKLVFAATAMGAYNTMAGATSFSVSPATPTSGKANTTFTVDGITGSPLTVSFTVTGAPGNPKSWSVTGTLPAGLSVTGGNPVNVSAPYKMTITGTPTAAGSATVTVTAWDTAGAKGNNASIKCAFNIVSGTTNTAPAITAQPQSLSITIGSGATFSVTATGSPAPTYQWQKGGVAIGGATGSSYSIASAQSGDAGSYSVVATNIAGSVTSSSATLTVNAAATAPAITAQPQSQTVTAGGSATFSVSATGSPAPTYQWQKGGVNIAGAASSSYVISSVQAGDAGSYSVVVTNSAGSVTSNGATLTVNAAATVPAISSQPQSLVVTAGAAASFSVTATGTPTPTYQWQKGGVSIAGATSSSYAISSAQAGDAGSYSVVVTNSAGSVTSSAATLTVNAAATAPAITTQPVAQTVTAGSGATFSVSATGSPAPSYQWQKGGVAINGATSASLIFASAQAADAGSYSVVVTNSAGSVTSNAVNLTITTVVTAPAITTQPQSQTVTAGNSISFSVGASGTAPFTYQWQKDGNNLSGATADTLTFASAHAADAGAYKVVVTNSAGSVTSNTANLTVNAATTAPSITSQPQSLTLVAGSSANFAVTATGVPAPTYQWQKGGVAIGGATGASLAIASVQSSDAGDYAVVVTNSAGSITSSVASLTVTAAVSAPSIVTQPQGQTVTAGSAASFSVSVGGTAPFTYQWKKDGVNLSGATAANLGLASTQSSDAGTYSVVVTNSAGSVTSAGASLTVNAPVQAPVITSAPVSQTGISGKGVSFTVEASNATAYQWEVSTNSGSTWSAVANGSTYSGATTPQLTIANASAGMSGYLYRAVITGSNGSVATNAATLSVASAVLAGPAGVALDRSGNLLAVDGPNNDCMTVALTGSTSLLAGLSGTQGADDGQGRSARFRSPVGVAINANTGTAYVADAGNSIIRAITADGQVSTLAGSKDNQGYRDGAGTAAWFNAPADVAVDRSGNLYVADTGNSVIRKITADGSVTTLAGLAGQRGSDNGAGSAARFNQPAGIVVDANGVLFVADTYNHTIRRITASGVVSTFAGVPGISGYDDGVNALFNQPSGLAMDASGNLYVADTGNNTLRVISTAGVVRTLVGTPTVAGLEDGNGLRALLNQPKDLCLDAAGNVWVADYGNAAIRKVTPSGDVTTVSLSMVPVTVPETPSTSNPNSSAGSSTTPTTTPPAEVGVGGGGGAPSNWFLLGLGLLAFLRRRLAVRRG